MRRKLGDLLRLAGGDGGVGNLRRRNGILETMSKVDRFIQHLNNILQFVTQQEADSKVLVDLECKSGRHRSVGQGFAAYRCLKVLGYDVVLIHASSWMWGEMRCGGVCNMNWKRDR